MWQASQTCRWREFLFLICFTCAVLEARADGKDIFDLKIRVEPGDTVTCATVPIKVVIEFANLTGATLTDLEVQTFFPNTLVKYCLLQAVTYPATPLPQALGGGRIGAIWRLGNLAPGKRDSIKYELRLLFPPRDIVYFNYVATVKARNADISEVSYFNTFVPRQCFGITRELDVSISKSANPDTVMTRQPVLFTLNVENHLSEDANEVKVVDRLPAGLGLDVGRVIPAPYRIEEAQGTQIITWLFPQLKSGASLTFSVPTVAEANPVTPLTLTNEAEVSHNGLDIIPSNDYSEATAVIMPRYEVALALRESLTGLVAPRQNETYTLIVTNNSTVQVENLTLTLNIADGLSGRNCYSIVANPNGGSIAADSASVVWTIASLQPGESTTISLTLAYDNISLEDPGQTIQFSAEIDKVFLGQADARPQDNSLTWTREKNNTFDLVLEGDNDRTATVNQSEQYELRITNNSLVTLPAVGLRARLEPHAGATNDQIQIDDAGGGHLEGLAIDWTLSGFAPDETLSRTFRATIRSPLTGGQYGFNLIAEVDVVQGEQNTQNNAKTWQTIATVTTNLVVTDVQTDVARAEIGGRANIRIDFANRGSLDKENAVLHAVIEPNPSLNVTITDVESGGTVSDNNKIQWTIASFPATGAASSGSRSFALVFDQVNEPAVYQIKVLGVIDPFDAADNTRDNRDSTTVQLTAMPLLTLSPISISAAPGLADTLIYTFRYSNQGNFPARNATLVITLPQATTFLRWYDENGQPSGEAATGGRLEASLGDLAPGAGQLVTVEVIVFRREDALRNFAGQTSIDLLFEVTLGAQQVPDVLQRRRDPLALPRLAESFYLTRNTYRPIEGATVEMYFDLVNDSNIEFKIYNLAGELVRSFPAQFGVLGSRVRAIWDGRNDGGELVASGLYFVFAEVDYKEEYPYRKLIVVR